MKKSFATVVLIGALAALPSERADAEERVKSVSCGVEQIEQD